MATTFKSSVEIDGYLSLTSGNWVQVPDGTTAQRPGSAVAGDIRYNSTTNTLEFYTGTGWLGTNVLPSINSVTGTIYNGITSNLVINANDITTTVSIKYSNNSTGAVIATDTSPSISGANITSAVPSAVYNTAAGTVIKIEVVKISTLIANKGKKTDSDSYTSISHMLIPPINISTPLIKQQLDNTDHSLVPLN